MTPRVQNCSKNDPKGAKWKTKSIPNEEPCLQNASNSYKILANRFNTNHQLNNNSRQWPGGLREVSIPLGKVFVGQLGQPRIAKFTDSFKDNHVELVTVSRTARHN